MVLWNLSNGYLLKIDKHDPYSYNRTNFVKSVIKCARRFIFGMQWGRCIEEQLSGDQVVLGWVLRDCSAVDRSPPGCEFEGRFLTKDIRVDGRSAGVRRRPRTRKRRTAIRHLSGMV